MEDLIKRSDAIKVLKDSVVEMGGDDFCEMGVHIDDIEAVVNAIPSANRPQGDSVSRRYLLAEIDDLADEFSEVDENGLHSERWCGILDSKGIIVNAPSASDRPKGEWVDAEIPLESGDTMPIQVCNLCKTFYPLAYTGGGHRFCPNCGSRMSKGADNE